MSQNESGTKAKKPSILYFGHHASFSGIGGGARLIHMLDVLERLQINTHLISYLPEKKFMVKHERRSNYLNVTTVHVPMFLPRILKVVFLPLLLLYGLRHIRRSDIVFSHGPSIVYGPPAFILAKIFRKPLLVDHPDIRDSATPKFVYNCVLKSSDTLFVISRYLEEEGKRLGCRRVIYIPIFIDTDTFKRDDVERIKIRRSLSINDKEIVIGYAGSFSHIEGLPFLLRAFKELASKHGNIKLVIIGGRNVSLSDDVAGLIKELALDERVTLVPLLPHELMPKYLSTFDIACSPKIDCAENRAANPVKIYEYMSMGLPMVISAVGEPVSVIENGIDGFLVKPGDAKDLERTLEGIILDPELAREVGQRAREKIVRNYTRQVLITSIEEALKGVLQNGN